MRLSRLLGLYKLPLEILRSLVIDSCLVRGRLRSSNYKHASSGESYSKATHLPDRVRLVR